jgi:hypothetical protein
MIQNMHRTIFALSDGSPHRIRVEPPGNGFVAVTPTSSVTRHQVKNEDRLSAVAPA